MRFGQRPRLSIRSDNQLSCCVTAALTLTGAGIFNLLCIDYALRPRLSSRLTLGGRAFPRKPYPYGEMDFNHFYRYSCPDSHFQPLHGHLPFPLQCCWNAFLPLLINQKSTTSVYILSPDHFRCKLSRWVSYYALFKWWLPLSQHPHCLGKFTSFSTEM